MNILQKIFRDNYEIIQYTLHPRAVEMENIEKMIHCGDPSFGGTMYACSHCGKMKFVPFRCKSRFCPTCSVKYCQERSTSIPSGGPWNGIPISSASLWKAVSLRMEPGVRKTF